MPEISLFYGIRVTMYYNAICHHIFMLNIMDIKH